MTRFLHGWNPAGLKLLGFWPLMLICLALVVAFPAKGRAATAKQCLKYSDKPGHTMLTCRFSGLRWFSFKASSGKSRMRLDFELACDAPSASNGGIDGAAYGHRLVIRGTFSERYNVPAPAPGEICNVSLKLWLLDPGQAGFSAKWSVQPRGAANHGGPDKSSPQFIHKAISVIKTQAFIT